MHFTPFVPHFIPHLNTTDCSQLMLQVACNTPLFSFCQAWLLPSSMERDISSLDQSFHLQHQEDWENLLAVDWELLFYRHILDLTGEALTMAPHSMGDLPLFSPREPQD